MSILPHNRVGGELTLKDFQNSSVMSPTKKDTKKKRPKDEQKSGTHPAYEGIWDSATTLRTPPNPPETHYKGDV